MDQLSFTASQLSIDRLTEKLVLHDEDSSLTGETFIVSSVTVCLQVRPGVTVQPAAAEENQHQVQ